MVLYQYNAFVRRVWRQHHLPRSWKASKAVAARMTTTRIAKQFPSSPARNGTIPTTEASATARRRRTTNTPLLPGSGTTVESHYPVELYVTLYFGAIGAGLALLWRNNSNYGSDEKKERPGSEPQCLYLKRQTEIPRSRWKEKCDEIGFPFSDYPGVTTTSKL